MKRFALVLCATAFLILPALPVLAQGCPYQFQPCSACSCFSGCFDKCCDGARADLCAAHVCQGQCSLATATAGDPAAAAPSFLAQPAACDAPASTDATSPLELLFPSLDDEKSAADE